LSGQAALLAMIGDGAPLTAKGVYNKHLLDELVDTHPYKENTK
jgi:hypothetical protein